MIRLGCVHREDRYEKMRSAHSACSAILPVLLFVAADVIRV